jgi:hypothetical protein
MSVLIGWPIKNTLTPHGKKMHVKEIYVIFIHLFDSGILLILLYLSIFYEYQQFFQHRICFSIQPPDCSDPWPRLARSSSFFLILIMLLNLGTVLTLCYFYLTTICSFLVFTVLILQCLRHTCISIHSLLVKNIHRILLLFN